MIYAGPEPGPGPPDARLDCSSHQSTLQQTRLMGINMPKLEKGKVEYGLELKIRLKYEDVEKT